MKDLAVIIAKWKAEAEVVRRRGNTAVADALAACADEAEESAEEWLTWLTEEDAALRSGFTVKWIRARFEAWVREGHARQNGKRSRIYRAAIIPRRANIIDATAAGRSAARQLQESAA